MSELSKKIFNWYNLSKYRNAIYGISAVWIIVFHVVGAFLESTGDFSPFALQLFRAGNVGVDVFLIMSGICLYFSLKKTGGKHVFQFYKRRYLKLLKIFVLVCIPFLIFFTIHEGEGLNYFISQITFTAHKGGQFWFIGCIAVCYLIYPLLFKLIENKKSWMIVAFIPIYFLFLCFLNARFSDFYLSYEIALVRLIPFLVGALLGKRVYEKRPMKQGVVLMIIALVFLYEAMILIMHKIGFLAPFYVAFGRVYLTILGLGTIYLIVMFFEVFKVPRFLKLLESIGVFSLEAYIVHIILLYVVTTLLGIEPQGLMQFLLCVFVFTVVSVLVGKGIQLLLNLIPPRVSQQKVATGAI